MTARRRTLIALALIVGTLGVWFTRRPPEPVPPAPTASPTSDPRIPGQDQGSAMRLADLPIEVEVPAPQAAPPLDAGAAP